jgi:hypothetical protein
MNRMTAKALAMALTALTAMAATPPKAFDAHDGGLWLFEANDMPPLMLTLRLSEKPDPENRDGFWNSVREAAEAGKPRRELFLMRFEKPAGWKGTLPDFDSAKRQIDAWFGGSDQCPACPELLSGVIPEEENTDIQLLDRIGDYIRTRYHAKCYQWLTEPWPPTLDLRADGWVFDAYSDTNEQFFARIEKFLLYGKPVVHIVWGSADWGGSWGYYKGKDIHEQQAILWRRMEWCRGFNLPVIVFAVYGDDGSVNRWYYGGTDTGKPAEFVAYRDAIKAYLHAMPSTPPPPVKPIDKWLRLKPEDDGTLNAVVKGNNFTIADVTNIDDPRNWRVTREGLRRLAPDGTLNWMLMTVERELTNVTVTIAYQSSQEASLEMARGETKALPTGEHEVQMKLESLISRRLTLKCGEGFLMKSLRLH